MDDKKALRAFATPGLRCPEPPADEEYRSVPLTFTACGGVDKEVVRANPVYVVLVFVYEDGEGVRAEAREVDDHGRWSQQITIQDRGPGNLYAHLLLNRDNESTWQMIKGRSKGVSSVHGIKGDEGLDETHDACAHSKDCK